MKSGRFGKDIKIRVPPGTVVHELVENDDGSETLIELGNLVLDNPELQVADGGEGGEGSGINKGRGVRRPRIPPQGGERKTLRLTLKIVADVALVGVPNAGKSTLLSACTAAKVNFEVSHYVILRIPILTMIVFLYFPSWQPRIANYPFTTIIPNLGVWIPSEIAYGGGKKFAGGAGSDGLVLCVSSRTVFQLDSTFLHHEYLTEIRHFRFRMFQG